MPDIRHLIFVRFDIFYFMSSSFSIKSKQNRDRLIDKEQADSSERGWERVEGSSKNGKERERKNS